MIRAAKEAAAIAKGEIEPARVTIVQRGEAMSTDFNWQAAFHKEHADAGALLTENYLLRKALRKIAEAPIPEQASLWIVAFENLRAIARKALGEE